MWVPILVFGNLLILPIYVATDVGINTDIIDMHVAIIVHLIVTQYYVIK